MIRHLLLIVLALSLGACAGQRANERADYWRAETERHLPPGAALEDARAFFRQRGLELVCCVEFGQGPRQYALDREVASSILMRYDIAVLVETTPEQRVARVTVQRWGVGF